MQQHGQKLALLGGSNDRIERSFLRRRKQELQLARLHPRHTENGRFLAQLDDPTFYQRLQRGARDDQLTNRFDRRALLLLAAQVGDDFLLIGVELAGHVLQRGDLHGAAGIADIAKVVAGDPLPAQQSLQQSARRSRRRTQGGFTDHFAIGEAV